MLTRRGQVSLFAIIGLFMVIITAAIITANSRISRSELDTEINRQSALNEDRLLLEWYSNEVIRAAAMESINRSNVTPANIEMNIARIFSTSQFSRRGAAAEAGYPAVKLTFTGKYLIVDANFSVRIQRSWGYVRINSRSVKVSYNGTAE